MNIVPVAADSIPAARSRPGKDPDPPENSVNFP
jgi:hypothetical protein